MPAISAIVMLIGALLVAVTPAQAMSEQELRALGKAVYFDRTRGNCITCHAIADPDARLPGQQGPPMIAMQQRYPDPRLLRAQIWDAGRNNPLTIMPPMGRHGILTEQEIDALVAYIYPF